MSRLTTLIRNRRTHFILPTGSVKSFRKGLFPYGFKEDGKRPTQLIVSSAMGQDFPDYEFAYDVILRRLSCLLNLSDRKIYILESITKEIT